MNPYSVQLIAQVERTAQIRGEHPTIIKRFLRYIETAGHEPIAEQDPNIINFGRYKDLSIYQVYDIDRPYLSWLSKSTRITDHQRATISRINPSSPR